MISEQSVWPRHLKIKKITAKLGVKNKKNTVENAENFLRFYNMFSISIRNVFLALLE